MVGRSPRHDRATTRTPPAANKDDVDQLNFIKVDALDVEDGDESDCTPVVSSSPYKHTGIN